MMTVGDHPDYLAVGYLLNQNMLRADDEITGDRLRRRPRDRRRAHRPAHQFREEAAQEDAHLGLRAGHRVRRPDGEVRRDRAAADAVLRTSWLYALARKINTRPSLYLAAGAIHGCVLCEEDRPLVYMEDVGRHNAIDKIAGYMHLELSPAGQDLLHHRPAHLGDGDQVRADAHPDPDLALGLHRVGRGAGEAGGPDAHRPRQGPALHRALRRGPHPVRRRPRTVEESERVQRKASLAERTRREDRRRCARGRAWRGAWAAATRAAARRRAADPRLGDRARAAAGRCALLNANGDPARFAGFGLPVVADGVAGLRRALWRACWPGSTGPPKTSPAPRMSRASPPTRRSCRAIWWRGSRRPCRATPSSPAPPRTGAIIPSSACGRSRFATSCAAPWSRTACARSISGPGATACAASSFRATRSIRSSMPTRPRISPRPSCSPRRLIVRCRRVR